MQANDQIGKFQIVRILGTGAMGQVYLAKDPLIDRSVAIKVIAAEADANSRDRFRHEARTIAQLSHPNIVQLYEFGFHENQPFLAMEYLEGESMDEWLRSAPTTAARARVLLGLCRAIEHAHARDVLHRDIKPSNVQVLPDGTAKLIDFGIARSQAVQLTATGTILGTPQFFAPEVLRAADYSHRSDLYAMALVVYQVFSGVNPFHADRLETCITRVLTHDPEPLVMHRPDLPAELSDAVARYLLKEPAARPSSIGPLMEALEQVAGGTATAGKIVAAAGSGADLAPTRRLAGKGAAASATGTAIRPRQKRRLWPAAMVLAAIAVAAIVVGMRWSQTPIVDQPATLTPDPKHGRGDTSSDALAAEAATRSQNTQPSEPVDSQRGDPGGGRQAREPSDVASAPPATRPAAAKPPQTLDRRTRAADGGSPSERPATERPVSPPPPQPVPPSTGAAAAAAGPSDDQATIPLREPSPAGGQPAVAANEPPATTMPPPRPPPAQNQQSETVPPASAPTQSAPTQSAPAETDRHKSEPSQGQHAAAKPSLRRIRPAFVRRGARVQMQIEGDGFVRSVRVEVRRGTRVLENLRVYKLIYQGPEKLRITLFVERSVPLGSYHVVVINAEGQESNRLPLEVGL